ncbi:hypothetical protein SANTM175S_03641 [Streptomyces antimycoticus]
MSRLRITGTGIVLGRPSLSAGKRNTSQSRLSANWRSSSAS